jgi:GT2 family glycosyltransferase
LEPSTITAGEQRSRRLAVAIPTVAPAGRLGACVESVLAQDGVEVDVLIVENGPKAVEECLRWEASGVTIERPGCNVGVAASWNRAATWAWGRGHDAVVLLNDDVCLTDPRALATMRTAIELDPRRALFLVGRGFSATCLSRVVLDEIGAFDAGFWPAYFEDNDMHRRLQLAGIAWLDLDVASEHSGSATIRGDSEIELLVATTFPGNAERYRAKWGGRPGEEQFGRAWNGWSRGGARIVIAIPTVVERADVCATTAAAYRDRTPVPVRVVTSTAPGGWCAGLNDIWRRCRGADVLVCASDDMVPDDDLWLAPLLEQLERGMLPAPCVIDPRWTNYGGFDEPVADGTPSPRCTFPVLARRWLDHVFPLPDDLHYFGDDLIRARLDCAGIPCAAVPSSRIVHLLDERVRGAGSGSEGARMAVYAPRYARELEVMRDPPRVASEPTFTVVVPTCGRPTLRRTLESLVLQLRDEDEAIVVADGVQPVAREICADFPRPRWRYVEHGPTGDSGNSQREAGIEIGRGDYLCFMDDDDAYLDGAFATLRAAVTDTPGRPMLFRMDNYGTLLWRAPELIYGNVGTPMLVAPFDRERLGRWNADDFQFIEQTLALQGDPVWREDVVAVVRPHSRA